MNLFHRDPASKLPRVDQKSLKFNPFKKKDKDVFELVELFADLFEVHQELKARDIVWLAIVANIACLAPYICTSESVTKWPGHLRNAKAHHQLTFANFMFGAFNLAKCNGDSGISKLKTWEFF